MKRRYCAGNKLFVSLSAAKAFAEAEFKKSGVVIAIEPEDVREADLNQDVEAELAGIKSLKGLI